MISGAAKLAGVIGWPIAHSKSPALHGHWLARYGIDGAYIPLPIEPEKLEQAVTALPDLGFSGINVTIPHKEAIAKLCAERSEDAERIGAVNTVVFEADGRLIGDNTDGFGFMENLVQAAPDWRADAGPAVVLGAGGACRAILWALLKAGCPEIRLTNRTRERADELQALFGSKVSVVDWEQRGSCLEEAALLVNTTSLGMSGQPGLEMDLSGLPAGALVTDNVYVPLETDLLAAAKDRGNPTVDGLGMLLHQARPGFAKWFGQEPQVDDALRQAVLDAF